MAGVLFLFKQKTAYEMRISDWSSDVCSSDLCIISLPTMMPPLFSMSSRPSMSLTVPPASRPSTMPAAMRSEERRVGKECVRTCRSRGSPSHSKQKKTADPREYLSHNYTEQTQLQYEAYNQTNITQLHQ